MVSDNIFERLQREERRAHYEAKRLREYRLSAQRRLANATEAQLRSAALLHEHTDWELSCMGQAARGELRKRGLLP